MNHHGNKKEKVDSVINSFVAGTHSGVPECFHQSSVASLGNVRRLAVAPLLKVERQQNKPIQKNPRDYKGHTHTCKV